MLLINSLQNILIYTWHGETKYLLYTLYDPLADTAHPWNVTSSHQGPKQGHRKSFLGSFSEKP